MIDFTIGAAWMAGTLILGGLGAWIWNVMQPKGQPDGQHDLGDKLGHLDKRIASLETKVNLLTAFRKPGEK